MADEYAPLNLRARLDALQDRINRARTQLEARGIGGDQMNILTGLVDQHESIRKSLDSEGTITELQHSKATAQTDSLESALDDWFSTLERNYANPPQRKPTASV